MKMVVMSFTVVFPGLLKLTVYELTLLLSGCYRKISFYFWWIVCSPFKFMVINANLL